MFTNEKFVNVLELTMDTEVFKVGSPKLVFRIRKSEVEVGNREGGSRKSEVGSRSQKSEV